MVMKISRAITDVANITVQIGSKLPCDRMDASAPIKAPTRKFEVDKSEEALPLNVSKWVINTPEVVGPTVPCSPTTNKNKTKTSQNSSIPNSNKPQLIASRSIWSRLAMLMIRKGFILSMRRIIKKLTMISMTPLQANVSANSNSSKPKYSIYINDTLVM